MSRHSGPARPNSDARLIAYLERFAYVRDTYCVQMPAGHYIRPYADPATKQRPLPLTLEDIGKHLRGETTLAFYTAARVGEETLCREGIMETDDKRALPGPGGVVAYELVNGRALMQAAHLRLQREGIASALELSRRGARVRVFSADPVPARSMQQLLLFALSAEERERMSRGQTAVEINPKQVELADGKVGNSVRGPFGLHLKSGERYPFIHPDGRPVATTLGEQLSYVLAVPTVDVAYEVSRRPWLEEERASLYDREREHGQSIDRGRTRVTGLALAEEASRSGGGANYDRSAQSPIEGWKASVSLAMVLARYGVEVHAGRNAHCPLPHHGDGDQTPSLSVDLERGIWFCHTAGRGGTQLDFVMESEGLTSPREAVAYLRGRGEIEPAVGERAQIAEARAWVASPEGGQRR